jgi:hypothetical protein
VLCREGEDRDRSHAHAQARSQSSDRLTCFLVFIMSNFSFVNWAYLDSCFCFRNRVVAGESDASAAACGDARGTGSYHYMDTKSRSHASITST